jgi:anti-sigma regulatory factor (Ser/Thr protein kinase)
MTKTSDSAVPDSEYFERADVVADAVNVVRLREELEQWLRSQFVLDTLRLNDLVLAVNEALANVAEFAYRHAPRIGAVELRAEYDRATSILTITVADNGTWRGTNEREDKRTRGRGIPLMEALSDEVGIDAGDHGTTVCMKFGNIAVAATRRSDEVPTA